MHATLSIACEFSSPYMNPVCIQWIPTRLILTTAVCCRICPTVWKCLNMPLVTLTQSSFPCVNDSIVFPAKDSGCEPVSNADNLRGVSRWKNVHLKRRILNLLIGPHHTEQIGTCNNKILFQITSQTSHSGHFAPPISKLALAASNCKQIIQ